jgi:hypothetical protein
MTGAQEAAALPGQPGRGIRLVPSTAQLINRTILRSRDGVVLELCLKRWADTGVQAWPFVIVDQI